MSKRFLYYCIAIGNRGILHHCGKPVLFERESDALLFLCSDEGREMQNQIGLSQTKLSVKRVIMQSCGW